MAMFYAHALGGYDENLHAFPGISSTVANDVRKYSVVSVYNNKYDIVKDKYMWCYSQVNKRYIGALLPMFECNEYLQIGVPIHDQEGNQISIITYRHKNYYALSGIGYESLDLCLEGVGIHHHTLEEGNAVYGRVQHDYSIIKDIAKEMNSVIPGPIIDYHVWIGDCICQVTAVDVHGKEIMRMRFKKGAVLQIPNLVKVKLGENDTENLSTTISALLNSGGGTIEVTSQEDQVKHVLMKRLESIRRMRSVAYDHFDIVNGKECCYIHMYSSNQNGMPSTVKTNLYMKTMSACIQMDSITALSYLDDLKESGGRCPPELPDIDYEDDEDIEDETTNARLAEEFFNRSELLLGEGFNFNRSINVKVTSISAKNLKPRIKQQLPSIISSFANTDGGYLFIGLDGKSNKVIGFTVGHDYLKLIENEIEKRIRRLHVVHFCEKKEDIKYACRFIKVYKPGEDTTSTYVCAIKVERCCCAVFADWPESWYMDTSGIKKYSPDEWVSSIKF
ncbi:Schlafen [Orthopoxvirus akhmetapox]|uniref:Schlafen n=1 Tax=Orthopoxvirus akhmetapox TaxID=2200830 RepID=A0A5J6CRT4_9POXV|nr:Schlafen [Akhmeta virus]QEQ49949.1 Schlafen [Akhmeta virus]